jgi:hypothetical protein
MLRHHWIDLRECVDVCMPFSDLLLHDVVPKQQHPFSRDRPESIQTGWSTTKTLCSTMFGIAREQRFADPTMTASAGLRVSAAWHCSATSACLDVCHHRRPGPRWLVRVGWSALAGPRWLVRVGWSALAGLQDKKFKKFTAR